MLLDAPAGEQSSEPPANTTNPMITFAFGFLAGMVFVLVLGELARIERDDLFSDRKVNGQRFDAPTQAGKP